MVIINVIIPPSSSSISWQAWGGDVLKFDGDAILVAWEALEGKEGAVLEVGEEEGPLVPSAAAAAAAAEAAAVGV